MLFLQLVIPNEKMRLRKLFFELNRITGIFHRKLLWSARAVLFLLSMLTFGVVIFDIGLHQSNYVNDIIDKYCSLALYIFFVVYFIKAVLTAKSHVFKLSYYLELFVFIVISAIIILKITGIKNSYDSSYISFLSEILLNKLLAYILFVIIFLLEFSKNMMFFYKLKSNPYKLFIYSYVFFILTGAGLLMLPNATYNGIRFVDALFTSTSAVCVTGLTVVDTATCFTGLGKLIIIFLIQIGGVGVMTFTTFFVLFTENKFSFQNRIFLKAVVGENEISRVVKTLIKIIGFTFIAEAVGAFFVFLNINHSPFFFGLRNKIFYSIFHSVSAFCNAGFSTTTDNLYHISTRYNYNVHIILAFLIIFGGLGFPIVFNYYKYFKYYLRNYYRKFRFKENFHHFPRLINVNTKIVVYTTLLLILFGFTAYFITEYNGTLRGLSTYGKIATAFFGSVTPRTAGFNTVNMAELSLPFIMICMLLMWIGASPSSTGGGIKTSAFALAVLNIISIGKGKNRVEIFKRQVSDDSIRSAFATLMLSILVIGVCVFIIAMAEKQLRLVSIMFECISAFGTVGLSLGITPELRDISKLVLVAAMYIGRIGTLTFFVAFLRKVKTLNYQYPPENIII